MIPVILAFALLSLAPPSSDPSCSIQPVVGGFPNEISITGSGLRPNEETAVTFETPSNTYGTYLTTSLADGTFEIGTYASGSGVYSVSVTQHRYDRPVAVCSATLT